VLQCVAVCCIVWQCVAAHSLEPRSYQLQCVAAHFGVLQLVTDTKKEKEKEKQRGETLERSGGARGETRGVEREKPKEKERESVCV